MPIESDMLHFPKSGFPVLANVGNSICLGTLYSTPLKANGFTLDVLGACRFNQVTIGSGGSAVTANGLLINPAGNTTAELKLVSTAGAGSTISFGSTGAIVSIIGVNQVFSGSVLEVVGGATIAGTSRTQYLSVHANGLYGACNVGTSLLGVDTPTGTPSSGGSIPNGTYYYLVTCVDYAGTETTQNKSIQSAAKVFSGSNGTIVLSWTAVAGAASYKIYRSTSSNSYATPSFLGTATATTYTDTANAPSAGGVLTFVFGGFGNKLNFTSAQSFIGTGGLSVMGGNLGVGKMAPTVALDVVGAATITTNLELGISTSSKGTIAFYGNTSGKVTIQPAAEAGTYTLTLPTGDGDANQVLTTDGSGVLSWTTPTSSNGVRLAYVTTTPTTGTTVECYLDADDTASEEITVNCSIVGGSDLNAAIPRIEVNDMIAVFYNGTAWYCCTTFQASTNCSV